MHPSIMCALNISPETTVPWPPSRFGHDLTGWVCYNWEAEGFEYASLILRYDRDRGEFVRAPAVFSSSVEHYLNRRAEFKEKLKDPALGDPERLYYKLQEGECKFMANSFYETAPLPCGPLTSGHGRRQISMVNECVSSFYRHSCPMLYGDTDSVMVSVGSSISTDGEPEGDEKNLLEDFASLSRAAMADKFKRAGSQVPEFLACVHRTLVEDTLKRMYVIESGNVPVRAIRDPKGTFTEDGYPVYAFRTPGAETLSDVTRPFVKDRRVKLEYENSSSVYCHVAKKSYVSLTHSLDQKGDLSSLSVKIRGLSAVKSMRSPCDSAVTETFIAYVILYPERELTVDDRGRWLQLDEAASLRFKVSKASVKTTYVEIVCTWLQKITGLSTKPVECNEFYKCNPCEAAFYRYLLREPGGMQATLARVSAAIRGRLKRATAAFNSIMNNCPEHMVPACGPSELERLTARRETVTRLPGEKLDACLKVLAGDLCLAPGEVYESLSAELGRALTRAASEGIARSLGDGDSTLFSCSGAGISLSLPVSMFTNCGLACSTGRLSLVRSEVSERALMDLAGLLYQTVLMLQIRSPLAFASAPGTYPDSVLCIMPYSREDPDLMRTWLETFKGMRWLKPAPVRLGKRTALQSEGLDGGRVTYHCAGCKDFYRDLFVKKVSGSTLIRSVYSSENRRLLGRCVNEAWWLP
ncbi:hypothetical protein F2P81_018429 [Scophthalmus maximus]|uniref:DNA-directed DNA polymerase n=1 Tax=Scophthalmus maximus TaxID=52904 RepID=A0A6A4SEL9_SCOMX|nr:hypothetical protein F2P81_018429 [Scophthalmus maximus]